MDLGLKGKVALVTGASWGIGREIALAFAREGASVMVHYHGHREEAEAAGSWLPDRRWALPSRKANHLRGGSYLDC